MDEEPVPRRVPVHKKIRIQTSHDGTQRDKYVEVGSLYVVNGPAGPQTMYSAHGLQSCGDEDYWLGLLEDEDS